jgi:hypothetical protein
MQDRAVDTRPLLVALALFLGIWFVIAFGWRFVPGFNEDFPSYHYAAVQAFKVQASPYGPEPYPGASEQLGQRVHPFLYPPPSLLALWPLARASWRCLSPAMSAISWRYG